MSEITFNLEEIMRWLKEHAPNANLQSDSRLIKKGDIFFAFPIPESTGDGRHYIQSAIDKGASLIVYEAENFVLDERCVVPSKAVFNLINHIGYIANTWHRYPDQEMYTVAVTGTNGKTSCTQWVARALSMLDESCAVIGTIGVGSYLNGSLDKITETGFTTPDAVQLQTQLAQLSEEKIKAIAIEASSIGLDQGRMNGMHIDTAVFTNLTLDHLDYHHTLNAYALAKETLFNWPKLKTAIINLDDEFGRTLIQKLKNNPELGLIAYGIENSINACSQKVIASQLRTTNQGTSFYVNSPFGEGQIKTQMIGRFNVSNILSVLCVLLSKGILWEKAVSIIEKLQSVPGRMQQLGSQGQALVVVDYAHTPDALEKTIEALQELVLERQGELWCVFGCGGDRDSSKRAPMGAIAQKAHHAVVTSDNPRTENPKDIIQDILLGMDEKSIVVEDRASAILYAIKHAKLNDVILIAGKGHESYQEINGKKMPFSDEQHALLALATVATNNSMRRGGK
jgi:UDP-N-acetylmuramoyl-L-alanyl-D-glutamate--2,6-diaminopimelate ligase